MRRSTSIKLLDLFGIRIGVDGSWFFILFLMIFWLSSAFRRALNSSDTVAYLTTVVTVLVLFGSLVIHELGHALAARREGIVVKRIDLYLFGGMTQLSRDTATPGEDFRIAAAGPLATLAFVVLCLVFDLVIVGPDRLVHAALLEGSVTPVKLSLSWLLLSNLLLLVFNLVPAFPLDGGRVARSIVWRMTASKQQGTRVSAKLGQGFAVMLAGIGIWLMLAYGAFSGLWLLAIAFLLGQSARAALLHTAFAERIEGVRVADIMDREPVAIPASSSLRSAQEQFFMRYGWDWFPVIDAGAHFIGIVRRERLDAARDGGEDWLTIASVLEADDSGSSRINEDRPITEVLASDALARLGALVAVDAEGVLRGVLTANQLRRAMQSAFSSRPA